MQMLWTLMIINTCKNISYSLNFKRKMHHYLLIERAKYKTGTKLYFGIFEVAEKRYKLEYNLTVKGYDDKPCPNNCSGNGKCNIGLCYCNEGYIDDDCLTKAFLINKN